MYPVNDSSTSLSSPRMNVEDAMVFSAMHSDSGQGPRLMSSASPPQVSSPNMRPLTPISPETPPPMLSTQTSNTNSISSMDDVHAVLQNGRASLQHFPNPLSFNSAVTSQVTPRVTPRTTPRLGPRLSPRRNVSYPEPITAAAVTPRQVVNGYLVVVHHPTDANQLIPVHVPVMWPQGNNMGVMGNV